MSDTITEGRTVAGYRFTAPNLPVAPKKRMPAKADRTGRKYGRLTVIEMLGVAPSQYRWWGCECECGQRVAVRSIGLEQGHTRSCGCLKTDTFARTRNDNKLSPGEASFRMLFALYQRGARKRHIEFNLTREEFRSLTKQGCAYCGTRPARRFIAGKSVNGAYLCNGVDRFNNDLGYTSENARPCCGECNIAKGSMSAEKWMAWLTRITIHRAPHIRGMRLRDNAWIVGDAA